VSNVQKTAAELIALIDKARWHPPKFYAIGDYPTSNNIETVVVPVANAKAFQELSSRLSELSDTLDYLARENWALHRVVDDLELQRDEWKEAHATVKAMLIRTDEQRVKMLSDRDLLGAKYNALKPEHEAVGDVLISGRISDSLVGAHIKAERVVRRMR